MEMNMTKVMALCSFEHGGRRPRDVEFEVNAQHAKLLVARGLVSLVGDSAADGSTITSGSDLVDQNAADVIAALSSVTEVGVLGEALAAEQSKGEKARKTVLEALAGAIAELSKE